METNNESTSTPRRAWYEIRLPALYLLVGVMLFGSAAFGVIVDGQSVISSVVSFLAGALLVLAALLTFLRRVRHGQPAVEQAPLAQESDPRLRQTR